MLRRLFTIAIPGILTATLAASWSHPRAEAQVVEEFYPAIGPPRLSEEPMIVDRLVVWERYGDRQWHIPDTIQCQDISLLDGPIVDLVEYPANKLGVLLSRDYLFRGADAGLGEQPQPVVARRIGPGCTLGKEEILVNEFGRAVGVSDQHVFLSVYSYAPVHESYRDSIVAKRLDRLGEPGTEALITVTTRKTHPGISRTEAASGSYFVWQDRDPAVRGDTWKLYVLDLSRGLPSEPVRILDTRLPSSNMFTQGIYLDLCGSYLVFQAGEEAIPESPWGIYFLNLAGDGDPLPLDTTTDQRTNLTWPAVSEDFAVWTRMTQFFQREAFGVRLTGGVPDGEPFSLGPGGNWIQISHNITVANGFTRPQDGLPTHEAIVVRELDLPGAHDVGDANADSNLNITDAVFLLSHLFSGGPRPRLRLADVDKDRSITISDAIVILQYLFLSGPWP